MFSGSHCRAVVARLCAPGPGGLGVGVGALTPTASRAASPPICLQATALTGLHLKIKTVLLLFVKKKSGRFEALG